MAERAGGCATTATTGRHTATNLLKVCNLAVWIAIAIAIQKKGHDGDDTSHAPLCHLLKSAAAAAPIDGEAKAKGNRWPACLLTGGIGGGR